MYLQKRAYFHSCISFSSVLELIIINTFKKNGAHDLANQMKSAHIQTFDSFSLELVEKYAGRLGLADTISIIDESIIKLKKTSILKEILNDYYTNDKERIIKTFKKFKN